MKKTVIRVLSVLWLAALLRLTVFRDGCFSHGLFSGRIEWDAFAYYAKLARIGYWRYFSYLFVGNLVWFLPVGVLVRKNAFPLGGHNNPGDCCGLDRRCGSYADATGIPPRRWQRASHASPQTDERRTNDARPPVMRQCAQDGRQIADAADAPRQRLPLLRAALWGFLLSLGIESMQYILGSGVSELDDLILNTAGAVLGYAFAKTPKPKSAC